MLRQSYTRIYFADEARNGADPILALVPTTPCHGHSTYPTEVALSIMGGSSQIS
jgi:hypothetical protein